MKMKRAATNKDCGSFFFVCRSQETRSHPAFFQLPLTAKLTAKPVDYGGFSWIGVDIRLACGAGGRRRCDYYHFFAVSWTHKIAVKRFSHARKLKDKGRVF